MTGGGKINLYSSSQGGQKMSFSCGAGPFISLNRITHNAVIFTAAGGPVTIADGSSATVGAYQITVISVDAGTAVFKVVAPS
jgi:hypothetical protein